MYYARTSSAVKVHVDVEFDCKMWTFLWLKTALNDLFHSDSAFSELPQLSSVDSSDES